MDGEAIATQATEHGFEMVLATQATTATEHVAEMAVATHMATATEHGTNRFRIQVEFKDDMWWEMPVALSCELLQTRASGAEEITYVWDWRDRRFGSYKTPEGESTTYNRYILNFRTMTQTNIDNNRTRRFRVMHVVQGEESIL